MPESHDDAGVPEAAGRGSDVDDASTSSPRRRGRRVTTPPPAGSDPTPAPEPPRHSSTENDARMRAEKPPHY